MHLIGICFTLPTVQHYLWLFYLDRRWKPWTSHTHTYRSKHSEPNHPSEISEGFIYLFWSKAANLNWQAAGTPSHAPWQRASTSFTCTPLDLKHRTFLQSQGPRGLYQWVIIPSVKFKSVKYGFLIFATTVVKKSQFFCLYQSRHIET
jgi:hypothetical protein